MAGVLPDPRELFNYHQQLIKEGYGPKEAMELIVKAQESHIQYALMLEMSAKLEKSRGLLESSGIEHNKLI